MRRKSGTENKGEVRMIFLHIEGGIRVRPSGKELRKVRGKLFNQPSRFMDQTD
jgi:hypothetical protein